jgi:hypothetical protein
MASFLRSLSNETPTMLSPLSASLYNCNNIWFSLRQGAHHDAQKSTIVTFPKLSLRKLSLRVREQQNLKFIWRLQLGQQ